MDINEQLSAEERLYDEVLLLRSENAKLEKRINNLIRDNKKRKGIMSKQSKRIQMLSGRKDPFHNEPPNKRKKGKRR